MANKKTHKIAKRVINQFYITAAPLLLAIAITVAWFTIESTTSFMPMSFAAAGTGVPDLYGAETVTRTALTEALVADDVKWNAYPIPVQDAIITIKNMVPGQTVYYKMKLPSAGGIKIDSISYLDETGNESTTVARDIGKYIAIYAKPIGDLDGVNTPVNISNSLTRNAFIAPETEGELAASMENIVTTVPLASDSGSFAIAIFYDYKDFGVYDKGTVLGTVSIKLSAVYSGKAQ